jgi:hypothetical protein
VCIAIRRIIRLESGAGARKVLPGGGVALATPGGGQPALAGVRRPF